MMQDGETQSIASLGLVEDTHITLEETLQRIQAASERLREEAQEAITHFRLSIKKTRWETTPLSESTLQAKPALARWLEERCLPNKITFQRFFEAFLDEHRKEYRCDISTRSIRLNRSAATLLAVPPETTMGFLDFMGHLPDLFV